MSDDQVTVLKLCSMKYPSLSSVYKLTPSLFTNFDTEGPARFIYFHNVNQVKQQKMDRSKTEFENHFAVTHVQGHYGIEGRRLSL